MKAYKHLFEFIYDTIGYSPAGGQDGLVCLIKKNSITQEDLRLAVF